MSSEWPAFVISFHRTDAGALPAKPSYQDPDAGGIADRPDNVSDVYHTFFGCAGLSLLGFPRLQAIDPVYAMPVDVVRRLGIARPYQQKGNAH